MRLIYIITPLVCAILFRLGGWGKGDKFLPIINKPLWGGNKWFRWIGIGLWCSLITCNIWHLPAYFLSTWMLGYGEKHPLRLIFGDDASWLIYGFFFGLSSFNWFQACISAFVFWFLMMWSNTSNNGKLDHAYVEFYTGLLGTMIYIWK